ncbi:hypothetical protein ABZX98_26065 [Streptomyces sp. NPDC002992]|uniref:hypothetical protein n=1 Tax=Streptomyces sp. NPDC002992 TaxID=3154273 RepID=UPI0033A8F536
MKPRAPLKPRVMLLAGGSGAWAHGTPGGDGWQKQNAGAYKGGELDKCLEVADSRLVTELPSSNGHASCSTHDALGARASVDNTFFLIKKNSGKCLAALLDLAVTLAGRIRGQIDRA